jgi:uncharacterized protein YjdB
MKKREIAFFVHKGRNLDVLPVKLMSMNKTKMKPSELMRKPGKKAICVFLFSLTAIFAFAISACDSIKPISVTGINITDEEKTILVGETISLTYELLPTNATNKQITWTSEDETVATVDNYGEVTGEALGETTITITTTEGKFSDTCTIYVVEDSIRVTGISLNQTTMTAYVGDTPRLIPTIQPSNATNKNVTWASTNTNVATINDGLISALSAGTTTISATTIDGGFISSCSLTVLEETLNDITVDSSADFDYGSYDTNYGMDTYRGINYGFYRADEDNDYFGMIKLFPSLSKYDYGALAGSFFNSDPISGIKKLTLSYISEGGLVVRYGDTRDRGYSQTIAPSTSNNWTTTTVSFSATSCFFSIETNNKIVYLNSIKIGYNSSLTPNANTIENIDARIAPTIYSGTLIDGISSISVPDDITISGDTYTINSYRSYTYYSYTYVNLHKNELDLSSIAMTDPVDVANYYIAFHAIPANYGNGNTVSETTGSKSGVNSLFGSDARLITQYTRTDGYAESVPWRASSGKSTPTYYEFDIALDDEYTTSSRSVGRLVMWVYGWTVYSDNAPVAVYTDDHYATFGEYLNNGSFGSRFDSEPDSAGYRTGYKNFLGSTQLDG